MKDLITFILGLIIGFAGLFLIVYAKHNNYESLWDYVHTVVGFGLTFIAYNKIDKSTN